MDSVSAEVNGPLTASVAVDNLYVGGGFGGGTLPDPITDKKLSLILKVSARSVSTSIVIYIFFINQSREFPDFTNYKYVRGYENIALVCGVH